VIGAQWPWWRVALAALLPWLVIFALVILGAPEWAAIGFGLVIWLQFLLAAALNDSLRRLAASPSHLPEEGDQ
jgi:type IV secretory pathway TrbD component